MNINLKHITTILIIIIALAGLNIYQYQNPKVVESPTGTIEIDSTAWVQRSAYLSRNMIIDSLKTQNEALAKKVDEYGDAIFSYANLTGRLRLQVDSLESQTWHNAPKPYTTLNTDSLTKAEISFLEKARNDVKTMQGFIDSTYMTERQFGDGLFIVTGLVEFRGGQFRQHLKLEQIRDIRLDVATTVNKNQSRVLTFVTSSDFESLEYKSYTELHTKTKLPKFWMGVATGVGVMAGALIILN